MQLIACPFGEMVFVVALGFFNFYFYILCYVSWLWCDQPATDCGRPVGALAFVFFTFGATLVLVFLVGVLSYSLCRILPISVVIYGLCMLMLIVYWVVLLLFERLIVRL